jgi:TRAP-type C4-dicarboxylate transport system substrate-binding protein
MDFKYAEMCKHVMILNGPIYPFAVVMNTDSWNALPKDVQDVMDGLGTQQAVWTGKYMDNHVKESVEWAKKTHNIEITELSKQEKAALEGLIAPITDQWIEDAKAKGLPAKAIIEDIKAFSKMYAAE